MERPAQYIGGEYNAVCKNWEEAGAKMAFVFPDTYEIGMSHFGLRVLYQIVNLSPHVMERAFAPQKDMEARMRSLGVPLFSLESKTALGNFDIMGFTLQYELSYTNILNLIDLAGLPVRAKDRDETMPLIIAGGPAAMNPEPMSVFFDAFIIGEGERILPEILDLYQSVYKSEGRDVFFERLSCMPGVYIPDLRSEDKHGYIIHKKVLPDLDKSPFPVKAIVPHTKAVQDRVVLEIMRGCTRGCRFCQAGMIYRPLREKNSALLLKQAEEAVSATGYEEIGLMSLSTSDYSRIEWLIDGISSSCGERGVSVSLPSLRMDAFSIGLAERVQKVRKSGLTFAPEAGSQRMRNIINKGLTEEEIISSAEAAFSQGWTSVKLYFMIGLPHETDDDIAAIAGLAKKILYAGRAKKPREIKRPVSISLGVATFVPKSHTPFQWDGQISVSEIKRRQDMLRSLIFPLKQIKIKFHDWQSSVLEAALARGDAALADVIYTAWRKGCLFDSWHEHFRYDLWEEAFKEHNLDIERLAAREFALEEVLPWAHISCGISFDWLLEERNKAERGIATPDCRNGDCSSCGVCATLSCGNITYNL